MQLLISIQFVGWNLWVSSRRVAPLLRAAVGVALLVILLPIHGTAAELTKAERTISELMALSVGKRQQGGHVEALEIARKALTLSRKELHPLHPFTAEALEQIGDLQADTADFVEAESHYLQALKIWEALFGENGAEYGLRSLQGLARLYEDIRAIGKASLYYERALRIQQIATGRESPELAQILENLGRVFHHLGDLERAEQYLTRALAIIEQTHGRNHAAVIPLIRRLARICRARGGQDLDRAAEYYMRAYAIAVAALHPARPTPLPSRQEILEAADVQSDYAEFARFVSAYADASTQRAALQKAEVLLANALAAKETILGPEDPRLIVTLQSLGAVRRDLGDHHRAMELLRRAQRIEGKFPDHVSDRWRPTTLVNLAILETKSGAYKSALQAFEQMISSEDRVIRSGFSGLSESQKLTHIESLSSNYFACLSMIHQFLRDDPLAVTAALSVVLRRKGIVFDLHFHERKALLRQASVADRSRLERLAVLRSILTRFALDPSGNASSDRDPEKLRRIAQELEELERRLAEYGARGSSNRFGNAVGVPDVLKTLPPGTALVELVRIADFDVEKAVWKGTWRYLAFVLSEGKNVVLVDLGKADVLETSTREALKEIKSLGEARSLADLYESAWKPLLPALGSTNKVLISPDGLLNLLPFAALRDSKGRYLVEDYRFAYLASGRDLVAAQDKFAAPQSDLFIAANPDFDVRIGVAGKEGDGTPRRRDPQVSMFERLPGTEREAHAVARLVPGPTERRQVLLGASATEAALKAARAPRILHLATHGFFLEDLPLGPDAERARKNGGYTTYENPLLRSGLAFAGANHASSAAQGDDGILTALEITDLNLDGTELVVLSACETGVGEVRNGEGVFGLRRAFMLAGVRNLMMSLWPVADEVTASQMQAFYRYMSAMAPAEALRQAQRQTIEELKKQHGFAPPMLWAPFFLQGAQSLGS